MSATLHSEVTPVSGVIAVRTFRPRWLTCDRCGHIWKSRAKLGTPRCSRCERAAKRAAIEASLVVTHS